MKLLTILLLRRYSDIEGRIETESAHCSFVHKKISDAFENNENFWKEMWNFGLLPTVDDALYGFSSILQPSQSEDPSESSKCISIVSPNESSFQSLTNDLILTIAQFKS